MTAIYLLASAFYVSFIYRTRFVVGDDTFFTLNDDAMISM